MAIKPSNGVALHYSSRYTARTIYAGAGMAVAVQFDVQR